MQDLTGIAISSLYRFHGKGLGLLAILAPSLGLVFCTNNLRSLFQDEFVGQNNFILSESCSSHGLGYFLHYISRAPSQRQYISIHTGHYILYKCFQSYFAIIES